MKYDEKEIHPRALNIDKIFNHEIILNITIGKYLDLIQYINDNIGEKHKDWRISVPHRVNSFNNTKYAIHKEHLNYFMKYSENIIVKITIRFKNKDKTTLFKLAWNT